MRDTRRLRQAPGQPPCPYEISYDPVRGPWTAQFPVSAPYTCEIEPYSHQIRRMHVHDLLEVGICREGIGILAVENRIMSFETGDVSIVNDQEMHMSRCNEGSISRWEYLWMDPSALLAGLPDAMDFAMQSDLGGPGFPNIISHRTHPEICQVVDSIFVELRAQLPGHRVVIRGLAAGLMTWLHRLRPQVRGEVVRQPQRVGMQRISPALQYITNHFAEDIEVDELARLCHLSPTQFRRVFVSGTGQPPLAYLAQVRSRMAAAILREQPDKSVTEVASEVGYEALNTFNRQFRETIGMNPSQWRRQSVAGSRR